jgi:PTH1 family peptidyl-tRNA hydrolase
MKMIVGLGNPGFSYRRTRHNFGFMVVNAIARERGIRLRRDRFRAVQGEGRIGSEQVVLLRPQTFMNRSGRAVAAAVERRNCALENILIICDDVDLPLGKLRMRRSGSAGGHKGMVSIIESLGSREFPRLRLGVGQPPEDVDMMSYVLGAFRRGEWPVVREAIARAVQAAETWVYHGIDEAMNRFN